MQGIINWFNSEKGFGFIKAADGRDVFLHYSQINGWSSVNIDTGTNVEFEIRATIRGLQAVNVFIK
jgi:CspA family cold shock protein